ncbi:MAG: DtxR family transcriptional regulator, Mn-dependent transcriptional regulator [Methanofollis sp.]|nr:DtxR family transcriptional regulator, Mn-dependent transcriptional regulator [Methanofollis sp.]
MRGRPHPDHLCGKRCNDDTTGGPLRHRHMISMAPGRCGRGPLSRKVEDYLEAIFRVAREKGYARTSDVAKELSVSPSSVVEMFQKLGHMGLVTYRRYEGVTLTPEGRSIAEVIVYRHETLKGFLSLIGVPERIAEEDACFMEHELHSETIERVRELVECLERSPAFKTEFEAFIKTREFERDRSGRR